jgi:hypothetical protein
MSTFLVPLTNVPQIFEIALGGVNYTLTCKWNDSDEGGWVLDITDVVSGDPIAANIPLITGADCLSGLEYLGITGQLVVFTDGDETAVPTLENLGVESNLYFLTDAA